MVFIAPMELWLSSRCPNVTIICIHERIVQPEINQAGATKHEAIMEGVSSLPCVGSCKEGLTVKGSLLLCKSQ